MGVYVCRTITSMTISIGFLYASLLSSQTASSLPLSASSQWIVDASSGSRAKLSCVNWASHFTPMLAEGLHLHPLESIAHTVATWGFNCVSLTWATRMFTNRTLAESRVSHTFRELGLESELGGVASFNGKLVGMTSVEAFKEVVRVLGKEGLMVVLDNRVGDEDAGFDDEIWAEGLQIAASLFKGWPFVVGMTLRPQLNWSTKGSWFRHMQKGAQAINTHNSDLLLIYQGFRNGEGLQSLLERPLANGLRQKVVYEVHIDMKQGAAHKQCEAVMQQMRKSVGFSSDSTMAHIGPLLVGGFGSDQFGPSMNERDSCVAPCFNAFADPQSDIDLAVSVLQGSYYLRQGVRDDDEPCGLFNHQWTAPRKATLRQNVRVLQAAFVQDHHKRPRMVLFHPPTALCVNKVNVNGLKMGSCYEASSWKFTPQGLIELDSTYLVLGARGPNLPAILELQGTQANGPWTFSKDNPSTDFVQVSTTLMGQTLCLDSPSPRSLLTTPCTCLDVSSPQKCKDTQWFTFVSRSY
ncbi:hypothetical protein GOP47_0007167 [Adiantum capillus-veneris]|uniref:Uncharacterized protein n=1 Tax=Adiantum capillus-veneris TaxID=13818 RepID=A0A9D4V123_ADICA|nr:hypothetical protein GOP47_0007167 [Adiantum capillus-veneris]